MQVYLGRIGPALRQSVVIALVVLSCAAFATAQKVASPADLTDKQWQDLFAALGSEDWNKAFQLSDGYLKFLKDDDSAKSIANLRYMHLLAAAGRVSEGNMTYDDFEKVANPLVGKKLVFPFRTISTACNGLEFNYICPRDSKNKVMTTATNKTATTILAFEYTDLKADFDFERNDGQPGAVVGTVRSIVPNPNKSRALIMRIFITDGYIILKEPQPKTLSKI